MRTGDYSSHIRVQQHDGDGHDPPVSQARELVLRHGSRQCEIDGVHICAGIANEEIAVRSLFHPQRSSVRLLTALVMIAAATLGLAACNTISGAGKDVSSAGSAISNTAQTVQQKL
jgi:predicted small secreted protein